MNRIGRRTLMAMGAVLAAVIVWQLLGVAVGPPKEMGTGGR